MVGGAGGNKKRGAGRGAEMGNSLFNETVSVGEDEKALEMDGEMAAA